MTPWIRKENEWTLGQREELSSTPTIATLHKHQPNLKANQKQNQHPLKLSFSTNFHGFSRKTKIKSKGGRGKAYHSMKTMEFQQEGRRIFLQKRKWVEMRDFGEKFMKCEGFERLMALWTDGSLLVGLLWRMDLWASMRSFNGDFPPWICSGRQRRRGEKRRHPLGNKPWKKELHHQECALDKKLEVDALMEEKKDIRGSTKLKE